MTRRRGEQTWTNIRVQITLRDVSQSGLTKSEAACFFETIKQLLTDCTANSALVTWIEHAMPPRPNSAPDEIEMTTVFKALKRRIGWLALLSAAVGGATFATLAMM